MSKLKSVLGLAVSVIALMTFFEHIFLWSGMPQTVKDISIVKINIIYITNMALLVFLIMYNIVLYKTRKDTNTWVLLVGLFCSFVWYMNYPKYFPNIDSGLMHLEWSVYFVCAAVNLLYVSSQIVYAALYYTKYKKTIKEEPIVW